MKATINPKVEFAKRHKKYHISFDDNEPYNTCCVFAFTTARGNPQAFL